MTASGLTETQVSLILDSRSVPYRSEAYQKALHFLMYGYYKFNYPASFYALYLNQCVEVYDPQALKMEPDELEAQIEAYQAHIGDIHYHPESLLDGLKVALEAKERGIMFLDRTDDNDLFVGDDDKKTITLSTRVEMENIHDYYQPSDDAQKEN